ESDVRSAAEPSLPRAVAAQGAQEVDLPELRPVRVAEVELGVGRLPEQEVRQPLFPRGADDQVGLGLTGGVEVRGDVVDGQLVGNLREGGAAGRAVAEQVADGLDDFLPAAVPDGEREVVAGGAGRGVL